MTEDGSAAAPARAPGAGAPPVLVVVAPQDIVNIGSAVRIARNFGIEEMRVVQPEVWDPYRIEGIAHHTADFIATIRHFDTLQDAIADCTYAMILTGRERAAKRRVLRAREAAVELVERSAAGRVAIVAGREDHGLMNDELDACQTLVTISANPEYTSLNLAQAIAIMCYELWIARGGDALPFKAPRREAPPAEGLTLERMFNDWERALWGIEFFKTRSAENVMRGFREILYRADLDEREAKLIRAMGIEVLRYLERIGGRISEPPGGFTGEIGSGTVPVARG